METQRVSGNGFLGSSNSIQPPQEYLNRLEKIYPVDESIKAKVIEAYDMIISKGGLKHYAIDQVAHLRRSQTGLSSTIEITPDGKVYLIFKDKLLGQGMERIVYEALELNSLQPKAYGKRKFEPNASDHAFKKHLNEFHFLKTLGPEIAIAYDHECVYASKDGSKRRISIMFERAYGSVETINFQTFSLPAQIQTLQEFFRNIKGLKEAGIHHRDLKEGNLLYIRDEQEGCFHLKLSDFSFATTFKEECKNYGLIGSLWYMAPEYVKGNLVLRNLNEHSKRLTNKKKAVVKAIKACNKKLYAIEKSSKKAGKNPADNFDYQCFQQEKIAGIDKLREVYAEERKFENAMRLALHYVINPAADMWAVGHILYFMAANRLFDPFKVKATEENFKALLLQLTQNDIDAGISKAAARDALN